METFTQFGPNFQIRMALVFNSFPASYGNIIDITKGLANKGPGSRYPVLWLTSDKHLNLGFYEDESKHDDKGHKMIYEGIELEKNYYVVIKLEDGLFQFIVNGEEVGRVVVENPQILSDMKLFLSNPWYDPMDGTIVYLHIDGSPGSKGGI